MKTSDCFLFAFESLSRRLESCREQKRHLMSLANFLSSPQEQEEEEEDLHKRRHWELFTPRPLSCLFLLTFSHSFYKISSSSSCWTSSSSSSLTLSIPPSFSSFFFFLLTFCFFLCLSAIGVLLFSMLFIFFFFFSLFFVVACSLGGLHHLTSALGEKWTRCQAAPDKNIQRKKKKIRRDETWKKDEETLPFRKTNLDCAKLRARRRRRRGKKRKAQMGMDLKTHKQKIERDMQIER